MSNPLTAYQRVLENGLFPYAIPYAEPKEERLASLMSLGRGVVTAYAWSLPFSPCPAFWQRGWVALLWPSPVQFCGPASLGWS